ncbi:MAG: low molecular weight protein-tyrosine phosphatase [Gaiellales bacterium]|nr:low molecular weight protein-tyrosine phosphatase [Gaiellales bacterium]
MTSNTPFAVLTVCTGNLHRSVLAEHVLTAAAGRMGLGWTVRSAGIAATPGRPIDPRTERVLARSRIPVTPGWTTHRVQPEALDAADLILVAAEEHRRAIAELDPGALTRVYLLRQFARLAAAVREAGGAPTGPDLVATANAARAHLQPVPPGADDIPDPVGRPDRVLRGCLRDIEAAIGTIVSAVNPAGAR